MTSEDERRVLRDAIDVLRLRDPVGNAARIDRLAMALADHKQGDCPSGVCSDPDCRLHYAHRGPHDIVGEDQ